MGTILDLATGELIEIEDAPPETIIPTRADVNAERDRRLNGTFSFMGVSFNCDRISLQRIAGAASQAGFYIFSGGTPTSTFWHGGAMPFAWIASDDSTVVMDAATTLAFGQAAATNEGAIVFAARDLKLMDPIPADYADDTYWPQG